MWYWRARANAWDVHQRELLALSERNLRLGLRCRRIELIEDHLEIICDVLDTANLAGVDEQAGARLAAADAGVPARPAGGRAAGVRARRLRT